VLEQEHLQDKLWRENQKGGCVGATHSNDAHANAFASRNAHSHSLMLSDAIADHGRSLCALAEPCKTKLSSALHQLPPKPSRTLTLNPESSAQDASFANKS
jgi:hypothetical protein